MVQLPPQNWPSRFREVFFLFPAHATDAPYYVQPNTGFHNGAPVLRNAVKTVRIFFSLSVSFQRFEGFGFLVFGVTI